MSLKTGLNNIEGVDELLVLWQQMPANCTLPPSGALNYDASPPKLARRS